MIINYHYSALTINKLAMIKQILFFMNISFLLYIYCDDDDAPFKVMHSVSNCTTQVRNDHHYSCDIMYVDNDPTYCVCMSTYDCTPSDIKNNPRYRFRMYTADEFLLNLRGAKKGLSDHCQVILNTVDRMKKGSWICTNKKDYVRKGKSSFYCDCQVKLLCSEEHNFVFIK